MAIWLWHGIAVYGYLALWLHDCIAIWLDGYVAMQLCHGMAVYGYVTIACIVAMSACRIRHEWQRTLDVLGQPSVRIRKITQIVRPRTTMTCQHIQHKQSIHKKSSVQRRGAQKVISAAAGRYQTKKNSACSACLAKPRCNRIIAHQRSSAG